MPRKLLFQRLRACGIPRWQQLTDIMRPRLVTMVERAISDGQICRRGDDLVMP